MIKKQPIRDRNSWTTIRAIEMERSSLGGAWHYRMRAIPLDFRDLEDPDYGYKHVGLRVVRNRK